MYVVRISMVSCSIASTCSVEKIRDNKVVKYYWVVSINWLIASGPCKGNTGTFYLSVQTIDGLPY